MKRQMCIGLFVIASLIAPGLADDEKKDPKFELLTHAELKKQEGVWAMKVATEKGWKGTVRATIVLYPAGSKQEGFGYILYDSDLERGKETSTLRNAPGCGIEFAGVRQGKRLLMVMADRELSASAPFKIEPTDELSAVVTWSDDKLRLDLSKSRKQFCSPLAKIDLDWNRLELTKVKK